MATWPCDLRQVEELLARYPAPWCLKRKGWSGVDVPGSGDRQAGTVATPPALADQIRKENRATIGPHRR